MKDIVRRRISEFNSRNERMIALIIIDVNEFANLRRKTSRFTRTLKEGYYCGNRNRFRVAAVICRQEIAVYQDKPSEEDFRTVKLLDKSVAHEQRLTLIHSLKKISSM